MPQEVKPETISVPTESRPTAREVATWILSNCAARYVKPEGFSQSPQDVINFQIHMAEVKIEAYAASSVLLPVRPIVCTRGPHQLQKVCPDAFGVPCSPPECLPDVELISAKVHDSWMATKRQMGFHGPNETCTANWPHSNIVQCTKYHDDLIPYEQLTDAKKELDRATVRTVLKAMSELAGLPLGESREPLPTIELNDFSRSLAEVSLAPEGLPELRDGNPFSFPRSTPLAELDCTICGQQLKNCKCPSVPAEIEPLITRLESALGPYRHDLVISRKEAIDLVREVTRTQEKP